MKHEKLWRYLLEVVELKNVKFEEEELEKRILNIMSFLRPENPKRRKKDEPYIPRAPYYQRRDVLHAALADLLGQNPDIRSAISAALGYRRGKLREKGEEMFMRLPRYKYWFGGEFRFKNLDEDELFEIVREMIECGDNKEYP